MLATLIGVVYYHLLILGVQNTYRLEMSTNEANMLLFGEYFGVWSSIRDSIFRIKSHYLPIQKHSYWTIIMWI